MGKTYTLEDLQKLIRDHLDHNNISQMNIWHNSGRVILMVNVKNESSFFLQKIKFSDELLDILKLPKKDNYQESIPGSPVELDIIRLCLNDIDLVYLRCKELDENYILENSTNSDLMAVIPLQYSADNGKLISYRDLNPLFHAITTRKTVFNLHFTIQDPEGNDFTAITALEVASVVTLTTGIGMAESIALASAGLILGVFSALIHKTQKVFDSKAKKHEKIKILAEAKLDSISGIFSKAIEDANISHDECKFILKEVEHYLTLEEQIRQKPKKVVDTITAELLEGREQGKQHIL